MKVPREARVFVDQRVNQVILGILDVRALRENRAI
jgi:hypothetical protein